MLYLIYAKWNLFCIYKRRFLNTYLLKKMNSSIVSLLLLAVFFVQMFLGYFVFDSILNISDMNLLVLNNVDIGKLLSDEKFIKFIFGIYVLITSIVISTKVGIFILTDSDEEWLSANYGLDCNKLKIIKIINYVLYNSKELLVFILPIILAFLNHWGQLDSIHIMESIILLLLILEIRILATILFCIYKVSLNSKNTNQVTIMTLVRNVIIFFAMLYVGGVFSEWIDRFPITSKKVDGEIVEAWFDEGFSIVVGLFKQYEDILAVGSQYILEILTLLFIAIPIFFLISVKIFVHLRSKSGCKNIRLIKPLESLCKRDLYFKTVLLNKNRIYDVKYLLESIMFWVTLGLFAGMMTHILHIKVIYFLCTSCALYVTVFFASENFSKNVYIYALDGEGKKVCFWLDNIPQLFRKKLKIWSANMISVAIVEYVVLYLCVARWEMILFCIMQSIYSVFLFFVLSVPGILFPYYEYSNISELEEYADRKKVSEMIEPILLLGVNSIIAIPVAIYICGYITCGTYMIIQFLVIPLLLCVGMALMWFAINKVIGGKEYLDKIYRR